MCQTDAGLFSNAYEVGVLMQMVLNGGNYGGRQYIQPETIEYYTPYENVLSSRGADDGIQKAMRLYESSNYEDANQTFDSLLTVLKFSN